MSEINPFTPKDNDQEHGESNVFLNLNKADEATGVPSVIPGMGNDAAGGGSSFSTGSAEPSKFNGQVMLAGLVFAIGVGSIYAMRYIGMQAGIKESVSMVDYTASTTSPDFVKRFDKIMDDLEEVSVSVQFDNDTVLPQEPFTMAKLDDPTDEYLAPPVNEDDMNAQMARLARQRAEQERLDREAVIQSYEKLASKLKLQSVIGGSRPVARISGEPVAIGMTVADTFKVLAINGSQVILEVEGMKYELGLGEGAKRIN
tara:strand:- start:1388 stop:2161 length:774 start_codon:yes stop_codon:yes gene_type:complete